MSHVAKCLMRVTFVVIFLVSLPGIAQANLITNGSFELGVNPPGPPGDPFQVVSTGDNSTLTGWTVGGPVGVDWIQENYWQAADGAYSLDLNALGAGAVSQSFATTAGVTYTMTYSLSLNPDTNPNFPTLRKATASAVNTADSTSLATTEHEFTFNELNSNYTDMNWQSYTLTFTASGDQTTIQFVSGNVDAGGVALDNVVVTGPTQPPVDPNPIPAPAGMILLVIGGLTGLGAKARNRLKAR